MSVTKRKNEYRSDVAHRNHVVRLINELDDTQPLSNALGEPLIFEDYVGNTERFSVTVIWSAWMDISGADRNKVILDAYEHSINRKGELSNINAVLGLTKSEAQSLGIPGAEGF